MNDANSHEELQARANQRVGQVLKGKYRLDRVIGIGGMAVVYAATHRNQKRVAVKMLHLELSFASNVRARFIREGYVANTVDHPGALAVLDDDVSDDGAAFLVMELLEGKALDAIAGGRGNSLSEPLVLAIGDQLLDVLAKAHEKAIVHRDIKPANVFVTRDGMVKVLDFGIARLRDAATHDATVTGVVLGTPAYMPPEQAYGRTAEIDGQSDVWAAGATLFQLLAGRSVHGGGTASEILIRAATMPAAPLASVRPDIHPRVSAIVDKALAFDKALRWPTAAAMRDAIRAAAEDVLRAAPSGKAALAALVADTGETDVSPQAVVATADTQAAAPAPRPLSNSLIDVALSAPPSGPLPLAPASSFTEGVTAGPVTRSSPPGHERPRVVRAALSGVGLAIAVAALGFGVLEFVTRPPQRAASVAANRNVGEPSLTASAAPAAPAAAPTSVDVTKADSAPGEAVSAPLPPVPSHAPVAVNPAPSSPSTRPAAPAPTSVAPRVLPTATPSAPRQLHPPNSPKPSDDDLFHP